jgi:hypothetical protein
LSNCGKIYQAAEECGILFALNFNLFKSYAQTIIPEYEFCCFYALYFIQNILPRKGTDKWQMKQ